MKNFECVEYKSQDEWLAHGRELFGYDYLQWVFVCPACGRKTKVLEYKEVGGQPDDAYSKCIGRFTGGKTGPHRCDWAAFGLFQGPSFVQFDGKKIPVFNFADDH